MANVVVAFSKAEDGKKIKRILIRCGFSAIAVCTSGAQALAQAADFGSGLLVCGYRLQDMLSTELADYLPSEFAVVLIASPDKLVSRVPERVRCISMPFKAQELCDTAMELAQELDRQRRRRRMQPRQRNEEEQNAIRDAKALLMERQGMTEEEAHRYIQKSSMDSGNSLAETARMLLCLMDGEYG